MSRSCCSTPPPTRDGLFALPPLSGLDRLPRMGIPWREGSPENYLDNAVVAEYIACGRVYWGRHACTEFPPSEAVILDAKVGRELGTGPSDGGGLQPTWQRRQGMRRGAFVFGVLVVLSLVFSTALAGSVADPGQRGPYEVGFTFFLLV